MLMHSMVAFKSLVFFFFGFHWDYIVGTEINDLRGTFSFPFFFSPLSFFFYFLELIDIMLIDLYIVIS